MNIKLFGRDVDKWVTKKYIYTNIRMYTAMWTNHVVLPFQQTSHYLNMQGTFQRKTYAPNDFKMTNTNRTRWLQKQRPD